MRIGLYVDAFNVYYGAKTQCKGSGADGWKWLDLPAVVEAKWPNHWRQFAPVLHRFVYCTADRNREGDPSSLQDQHAYIAGLGAKYQTMLVEHGYYVSRMKSGVLIDRRQRRPQRVSSPGLSLLPTWLDASEVSSPSGGPDELLVAVTTFEEKGSDVNVASHLLADVFSGTIDAAIVVSNDSDLAVPLRMARDRVPVGTVNPTSRYLAKALAGESDNTLAASHWWARLSEPDFRRHQLPNPSGPHARPAGW